MTEKTSLGAYVIMYVVKNKKSQVLQLLLKNGVVVPSNASDMQIALLVTNLLKVSKSFYEDFTVLFLNQEMVNEMNSNISGSYLNIEGDFCKNLNNKTESPTLYNALCKGSSSTTTSELTSTETKTSNSSWLNTGLDLVQTGFAGFLKLDDNKTKRDLANASVKISSDTVKKEEITPTKAGLSTGAIVGISLLGVTVVGLVIYLIAKKK